MATDTRRIVPRKITDDEAKFFQANGWISLENFISAADAHAMLDRIRGLMGPDASKVEHPRAGDGAAKNGFFHTWEPLSIVQLTGESSDEMFYEFSHSAEFGRQGAKLVGEPVRFWVDGALVKMPQHGSTGAGPTAWHQDVGAWEKSPFSTRATGSFQFWIALTDVPYERGTMRFVGKDNQTAEVRKILEEYRDDPVASYPLLEDLGAISPVLNMKAGDATVHAASTMHSAPSNNSDEPRWAYINSMFPANAAWTGHSFWVVDDVAGVEKGKTFPDHRFPVLG